MTKVSKKVLVLLPVVALAFFYLRDHYETYNHIKNKRLLLLMLNFVILYGWIFLEILIRKQKNFFQVLTQASFYVYIFMVLTLTGYFILFREISSHDWWHKMMVRIDRRDHVNLELFKMFKIYKVFSKQIVGNFLMLLPLGIFLPLLYKRTSNFFLVFVISFLLSTSIELIQLITSFRSADVDDVFLNTMGACTGFLFYKVALLALRPMTQSPIVLTNN